MVGSVEIPSAIWSKGELIEEWFLLKVNDELLDQAKKGKEPSLQSQIGLGIVGNGKICLQVC